MSSTTETIRAAIAGNLRHARRAKGLSLRDLAERAGVSKALLSQLEREIANPTIEVLAAIAVALEIDFTDLMRAPLYEPQVVRAEPGQDARTLFSSPDRRRFELYEASIPAHDIRDSAPHGRGSEEIGYVLSGRITLEVGQWRIHLDPGDTVRFSGESEHAYSTGPAPSRLLTLLSMPSE